jgi:hypothetical protein
MNKKKLTRKEFEAGAKFYVGDDDWHSYNCAVDECGAYIYKDGKFLCSVGVDITDEGFHVFAHVLNIPVSGFVKFDDCTTDGRK